MTDMIWITDWAGFWMGPLRWLSANNVPKPKSTHCPHWYLYISKSRRYRSWTGPGLCHLLHLLLWYHLEAVSDWAVGQRWIKTLVSMLNSLWKKLIYVIGIWSPKFRLSVEIHWFSHLTCFPPQSCRPWCHLWSRKTAGDSCPVWRWQEIWD